MNEALTSINTVDSSWLNNVGLCHYLVLALILFLIGAMIAISSKNMIKILIGLEFMVNAACINFAAADTFLTAVKAPGGQVLSLIVSAIGAINAAAGLALIIVIYFRLKNVAVSGFCTLKSPECPENKGFSTEEPLKEDEI